MPRHVGIMRGHRILTLLLLLCGLSTTPFFSLEQSTDDGLTASSVPQCGTRLKGKTLESAGAEAGAPDVCDLHGHDSPVALGDDAGWSTSHPGSVASTAPISYPFSGTERLTYHANAPPAASVSKS